MCVGAEATAECLEQHAGDACQRCGAVWCLTDSRQQVAALLGADTTQIAVESTKPQLPQPVWA